MRAGLEVKDLAAIASKVKIARESGTFVVLTVEEAEALVKAADGREQTMQIVCDRCGSQATVHVCGGTLPL